MLSHVCVRYSYPWSNFARLAVVTNGGEFRLSLKRNSCHGPTQVCLMTGGAVLLFNGYELNTDDRR